MFGFLKRLFGSSTSSSSGNMAYSPMIGASRTVREFTVGELNARLLTDIESKGSVDYTHIMAFTDKDGAQVYFTAAEVNGMAAAFGGGSHFLGLFDGKGHTSLSCEDKWGDLETFAEESVKIVKKHFEITD